MKNIIQKSRLIIAGILAISAIGASVMMPSSAAAASSCDKVNIVYCGLTGSSDASYISSFKSVYTSDKSGHVASPTVKKDYTDIQSVYAWAGASNSMIAGMTTDNTKLGTMYKNGNIVVDGKVVATDAWVSARFTEGTGFVHVEGNVYARKTTTSLAESSAPVLVYMPSGTFKFAAMIGCANAVKATPKTTPTTPTTPSTPTAPSTPTTPTTTVTTASATVTQPTSLPNTGPGEIVGLFAGTSITGAAAHKLFNRRRK